MKKILAEIRSGSFAKKLDRRERGGAPVVRAGAARGSASSRSSKVGASLRQMMPFLDPVTVKPEMQG